MVALATFVAGCGYTEIHQVVLRQPSKPTDRVELYFADKLPARPYYEIAILQVIGHGGDANLEDVTDALRDRAESLGCDAIVRTRVDQGYSMAHGFAVCAKWSSAHGSSPVGPATASPPAPPPPSSSPVEPSLPGMTPRSPSPPPAPAPVPSPAGRGPEEFGL